MVLSKHVRYCRRGVSLTRRVTESAKSRDASTNLKTILAKSKSTMQNVQNQWKVVTQLKGYLSKSEPNLLSFLNKYWIDTIQKMTYPGLESIRTFSGDDDPEKKKNGEMSEKSAAVSKSVKVQLPSVDSEIRQPTPTNLNLSVKKDEPQPNSTSDEIIQNTKDQIMAFPQVLSELFVKFNSKGKEAPISTIPKWKTNINNNISKHSIASRTKHVLNSIVTAESNGSKCKRIEDLLTHINQYPEARHHAIKEGAIRTLLKIRQKSKEEQVTGAVREALAVMGYVDPIPRRGIRILSIDGGGVRGLLVLEMLKKLEELTGQKVHEMFDYMCGVSTGAILSATFGGHKKKSLNEICELYKELSTKIFSQGALKGTSNLVWSHAYYDTALLEQLLQEHLGDKDLITTARDPTSPKFSAIASIFDHVHTMAYIFRNYTLPPRVESQYMGSHRHKLWEAVRASAAAPTYFEEFKHGNYVLSDGGIMVNNPCAVAIHEAKLLWPNTPIQCVVSFGTGRTPPSIFDPDNPSVEIGASSWKAKFDKILASATDTEGVHTMLNDLMPDHVYFRFNPYLSEMVSMEEKRAEKLAQLEQDALMYIRKNEDKFIHAAISLNQKKSQPQKIIDWINLQRHLLGMN